MTDPDPMTVVGLTALHVRPDDAVTVNETVPLNPLIGVTVAVQVMDVPTGEGPPHESDSEKSVKLNVAVVE